MPLLPRQILLLNFLSDIPGTTIAGDSVDPEQLQQPRAWNLRSIRTFMIIFGLISSVFDILTFLTLRLGFQVGASLFRSGWFIESTVTELAVMLVLRTNRPFWRSRPGRALLGSSIAVAAITLALPYSPLAGPLGLAAVPARILGVLVRLTALYVLANELAKRRYHPETVRPRLASVKVSLNRNAPWWQLVADDQLTAAVPSPGGGIVGGLLPAWRRPGR